MIDILDILQLFPPFADEVTYPALPADEGAFDGGGIFDAPADKPFFAWPLPENLVDLPLIVNRIGSTSRTWVRNIDYLLQDGYAIFRDNPFLDPLVTTVGILADNVVTDTQAQLWGFMADYDTQSVYQQYGYALGLNSPSSQSYKDLVNAVFDALVGGTSMGSFYAALSAVTGIPLVKQDGEIVEYALNEGGQLLIVTDQNAYVFPETANATAAVGDVLPAGASMTDLLEIITLADGSTPDPETIGGLAMGRGFLYAGFMGELVFLNQDVPLIVTTDAAGYTMLSWELPGWPGDVTMFFDDLQARGVASGETLAHLLDQRPLASRDTEPSAGALPATINPLAFLCRNILRASTTIVKIRNVSGGTGLNAAKILRKMTPPHAAIILMVELEADDPPIIMDQAGTDAAPGYEESVALSLELAGDEALDPSGMIQEYVKVSLIGGRCI